MRQPAMKSYVSFVMDSIGVSALVSDVGQPLSYSASDNKTIYVKQRHTVASAAG